jgi:hypothetical protein
LRFVLLALLATSLLLLLLLLLPPPPPPPLLLLLALRLELANLVAIPCRITNIVLLTLDVTLDDGFSLLSLLVAPSLWNSSLKLLKAGSSIASSKDFEDRGTGEFDDVSFIVTLFSSTIGLLMSGAIVAFTVSGIPPFDVASTSTPLLALA